MSDDYLMSQCVLRKGKSTQVAWIPAKFAKVGKKIELKENGEWEEGWEVQSIYHSSRFYEVRERSQDYKKQRLASDI